MALRTTMLGLVLSFAALASAPAVAKDADMQAKELLAAYKTQLKASRDISDDDGWNAFRKRLRILRDLGPLDCPRSRDGLAKIARSGKRLDDRLLAAQGLARSASLEVIRRLVEDLGRKGHPVLTQAAAEALETNKHADVLAWLAQAPDEVRSPGALAIVLRAGRTAPISVDLLTALFDKNVDKSTAIDLCYDAIQALGKAHVPAATTRILTAAGHADLRLRLAAADVLPARPQSKALDAIMRKLLADDEALVRYAMLMALGKAKAMHLVPEISERLADDDRRTRKTALDVLKKLSGKDFGFDMGAWRRWHESKGDGEKPASHTVPSYYGVPIWSDRLAFILDKSGSMRWPADPAVTTRMAVAQAELQRVLGILPKGTLLNVLAFDSHVASWQKAEAAADKKAIARAARWVAKQESERGAYTNTYGVLERTLLQNPRIDTIYLLSDGIPEWGDVISREGLLAAVRSWNRFRRVTINTFAITHMSLNPGKYARKASMNRAETFMRDLAAAGGGQYRFVKRPPN